MSLEKILLDRYFQRLLGKLSLGQRAVYEFNRLSQASLSKMQPEEKEMLFLEFSKDFRLMQPRSQEFLTSSFVTLFNKDLRASFIRENSFCLSETQIHSLTFAEKTLDEELDLVEQKIRSVDAARGFSEEVDISAFYSRLKAEGLLSQLLRAYSLPLEFPSEFKAHVMSKLERSHQISRVDLVDDIEIFEIKSESAMVFFTREFQQSSYRNLRSVKNEFYNNSVSDFYLNQPFGIYAIKSASSTGDYYIYEHLSGRLFNKRGEIFESTETIRSVEDKAACITALSALGCYSFLSNHSKFKNEYIEVFESETNSINLLFAIANSPDYSDYYSPECAKKVGELIEKFEGSLRYSLYDCLRSPCRSYDRLFSKLDTMSSDISDSIIYDLVSGKIAQVSLNSPSRIVRQCFIQYCGESPSVIQKLMDFLKNDEDTTTRVLIAEKLLQIDQSRQDQLLSEGSGTVAAKEMLARSSLSSNELNLSINKLMVTLQTNDDISVYLAVSNSPRFAKLLAESRVPEKDNSSSHPGTKGGSRSTKMGIN